MQLNDYTTNWEETGEVLKKFHVACNQTHGWPYEAGWLSSTLQRLISTLPLDQMEQELEMFKSQTRQLEAIAIVSKLTG